MTNDSSASVAPTARHDYFQMVPRLYAEVIKDPVTHRLLTHYASFQECYESVRTTAQAIGVSPSTVRRRRKALATTPARQWLPEEFQALVPENDATPLLTLGDLKRNDLHPQWGTRYVWTADVWELNQRYQAHKRTLKTQAKAEGARRGGAVMVVGAETLPPAPAVPDATWAMALRQSSVAHLLQPVLESADPERVERYVAAYLYAMCNQVNVGGTLKWPTQYAVKHSEKDTPASAFEAEWVQAGPQSVALALIELRTGEWGQSTRWSFPAKASAGARAEAAKVAIAELGLRGYVPEPVVVSETPKPEGEALPLESEEPEPVPTREEQMWAEIVRLLQREVPAARLTPWLKEVSLAQCSETVAVIRVPSAYAYDWLRHQLSEKIQRALAETLSGAHPTLQWEVAGKLLEPTTEQLADAWRVAQTQLPTKVKALTSGARLVAMQADEATIHCDTPEGAERLQAYLPDLIRALGAANAHLLSTVRLMTATSPP